MTLQQFDNRLLSVQIEVSGQLLTFDQSAWIRAKGNKFANELQNTCDVEITNLDRATRNYLLTETSPFNANRTPKVVNVYAGRVSYGSYLVYTGHVASSKPTQPPDIQLAMKCGTHHFKKGSVGNRSGGAVASLHTLATGVASNIGVSLKNQATNKNVANYAYSGNALDEVRALGDAGNVDAFIDDNTLVVKDTQIPLTGEMLILNAQSGMIGIPEVTDKGLKVKFLFNPAAKLGGALQITSAINPAANGTFVIYKLSFDLASREPEFYYTAECIKAAGT